MARKRGDAAPGPRQSDPCRSCGAVCCRYISAVLAPPRESDDVDQIRWYLAHRKVSIYIDRDGEWHLQVGTNCRHIAADGRCEIYARRPKLCRDYATHSCERADHDDRNIAEFDTVEEFERFFALNYRITGDRVRRRHRRYRPAP